MTVEFYLGRLFCHGHERRALGLFARDLLHKFEQSDGLYMVICEVDAGAAAMDLLLLSPRSLIIADLKQLTAARPDQAGQIHLSGKQNGQWLYRLPEDVGLKPMGGEAGRNKNPYKQLEQMRYNFADWLADHSRSILGEVWTRTQALDHLKAWVAISPGFDGDTSDLDLPWNEIYDKFDWFKVLPLKDLAWEFHCTTNLRHEFTERQLRELVTQLGATRVEHLGSILPDDFPDDLPPAPPSTLFTRPPLVKTFIDRQDKLAELVEAMTDPLVSFACVKGLGGMGKSHLVAAAVPAIEKQGWSVRWVACAEKDLTLESFLAAVAAEMPDSARANLIIDKEGYTLLDRLDAALDFLEDFGLVLICDDFQRVADPQGLDPLFRRILARSERLKVIFISRDHPLFLDGPHCPPGSAREIILNGLEKRYMRDYFQVDGQLEIEEDLVYERTEGNPYAMGLFRPLVRKYGWSERIASLPLYKNDHGQWFDSLLETLTPPARQLAEKLSTVRALIPQELINFLEHDPERGLELSIELREDFVLHPAGQPGAYRMHEFLREYLYDQLPVPRRIKLHQNAARYYQHQAEKSSDSYTKADMLFEAIQHSTQAGNLKEIAQISQPAYDFLYLHGDWSRAHQVAEKALNATRSLGDSFATASWLIHIAGWETEHGMVEQATQHLAQSATQLPQPKPKAREAELRRHAEIMAKIGLGKARLAYYSTDYAAASQHLDTAIALARSAGNQALYAECLMRTGRIERQRGLFNEAAAHFEEARLLAIQENDPRSLVESISHLALIARQQGNLDEARQLFSQAHTTSLETGYRRGMEINHSLLGDLERREGNYTLAAEIFRDSLRLARQTGSAVGIRINLGQLAESLIYLGELDEAEQLLEEAEGRCQVASDGIGLAWTWRRRGLALKQRGKLHEGNALIEKGITKLVEAGSEVYISDFERDLGADQLHLPGFDR